jgi:hypothetical protein
MLQLSKIFVYLSKNKFMPKLKLDGTPKLSGGYRSGAGRPKEFNTGVSIRVNKNLIAQHGVQFVRDFLMTKLGELCRKV